MSKIQASFNPVLLGEAFIENATSSIKYLIRYKTVTDSGEQTSEESVISWIDYESISDIISGYTPKYTISSVESGGEKINIKWTVPDSLETTELDIYLAWSYDGTTYPDGFVYIDRVLSHNYYIDIPYSSGVKAKKVKFAVQIPTNLKMLNSNAKLFETTGVTTLPYLDAGTI